MLTLFASFISTLADIAAGLGCQPAQVALAWVLSRGDDIVPIPGTKRRPYLEENVAAGQIALPADVLDRLAKAFPPGVAAGARYHDAMIGEMGR